MKKHFSKIRILAILLLIVGFGTWRIINKKETTPTLQTSKVEKGAIVSSVSASGQILSANIINITTKAGGLVKKVYVREGDRVVAGQKILEMVLDSDSLAKSASAYAAYLSAKNSLVTSQTAMYTLQSEMFAKWKAFKDLAESTNYDTAEERNLPQFRMAENDWLATEAKYKNQQLVIAQSQSSVNNAWLSYQQASPVLTSPFAGVISNITVSPGMVLGTLADASQRVAVIKSEGTPMASYNLSEIDVTKVKPGQKATIKLDSLAGKTFTGKVMTVDRIGTTTSGVTSYPVIIKFDTEAEDILPNMTATANIILETKNDVLLAPSSAIQKQNDQEIIRVKKGNQQETVVVETGLSSDTQTEIVSGLSEGDEVIISTVTGSSSQQGGSVFGGNNPSRMFIGR